MPEAKKRMPWWGWVCIACGVLLFSVWVTWVKLPDIAAFGLKYDMTHELSRKTFYWLGPRAVNHMLETWKPSDGWQIAFVAVMCRKAEGDAHYRNLLLDTLREPDIGKPNMTLLHVAAGQGCAMLAEQLLAKGADVNSAGHYGFTPLRSVVLGSCSKKVVDLLIKHGADPNLTDVDGYTLLHLVGHSVFVVPGHVGVIQSLIDGGADVNAESESWYSPLHAAVELQKPHIVEVLLENGADPNHHTDAVNTPMHSAADRGYVEIAEILLAGGADVDIPGAEDNTPLHFAVKWGQLRFAEWLLAHGANPSRVTRSDRTPLKCAIDGGRDDIVDIFFKHGAKVNVLDTSGQTTLDYCLATRSWGNPSVESIANLLRQHGAKTAEELRKEQEAKE